VLFPYEPFAMSLKKRADGSIAFAVLMKSAQAGMFEFVA